MVTRRSKATSSNWSEAARNLRRAKQLLAKYELPLGLMEASSQPRDWDDLLNKMD